METKVVIMAGGQGTRFWPKSRMRAPKQFLSFDEGGESLIQATARRVLPIVSSSDIWVVTNELHKGLVEKHLPSSKILAEPVARNTAASIGLAAIHLRRFSPQSVMLVLPADHVVQDENRFREVLGRAVELASSADLLVTIGIQATSPHTGYGYIKRGELIRQGAYTVSRFYEKPNLERAKEYCGSGQFYWNGGMFAWKPEVVLASIKEYMPRLYDGLSEIEATIGTSKEAETMRRVFESMESTSIDLGVLERARNCAVVSAEEFGWNDVGAWDAWADYFAKDPQGNRAAGDVLIMDSHDCVARSEGRLIALLGVEDLVVIDSGDALLVCPRNRVQDVKMIVEELKRRGRVELI